MGSSTPSRIVALAELTPADRKAWRDLSVRTGGGYFTGPAWASAWHHAFAGGGRTEVGWWGSPERPEAVAGMVLIREPMLPRGGAGPRLSVWHNLGSGPGGGDHLGFPSVEERRGDVIGWVLARPGTVRLSSLRSDWAVPLARHRLRSPERTRTYPVDLEGGSRPGSKKLWKHIARSRRHLLEAGVVFDIAAGVELDESVLGELFDLHGVRSERAGRSTTFTAERLEFHRRLAAGSDEVHSSYLVSARLGGRLVGALYGFWDPTRLHYYQSGWDPAYERYSLGSVLIGEAIDLAAQRQATVFDFLRGDEPYKLRFGAGVAEDLSVLVPRGPGGRVLVSRDRLYDQVRRRRSVGVSG